MASRPKGYGMSAELERKKAAKYDPAMEAEARQFISESIGEPVDGEFHVVLKDGVILCKLANTILGAKIKANSSKMAFKQMENISKYLKACEDFGLQKIDLFQTVDLYEAQNMPVVILSILAVKRKIEGRESTENKREFTEEQLRAGQGVIGLQAGSNKGASQAGDHFGRPRQVAGANVYQ